MGSPLRLGTSILGKSSRVPDVASLCLEEEGRFSVPLKKWDVGRAAVAVGGFCGNVELSSGFQWRWASACWH